MELRLPAPVGVGRRGPIPCEVNGVATEAESGRYFDAATFLVTRNVPAGATLRVRGLPQHGTIDRGE